MYNWKRIGGCLSLYFGITLCIMFSIYDSGISYTTDGKSLSKDIPNIMSEYDRAPWGWQSSWLPFRLWWQVNEIPEIFQQELYFNATAAMDDHQNRLQLGFPTEYSTSINGPMQPCAKASRRLKLLSRWTNVIQDQSYEFQRHFHQLNIGQYLLDMHIYGTQPGPRQKLLWYINGTVCPLAHWVNLAIPELSWETTLLEEQIQSAPSIVEMLGPSVYKSRAVLHDESNLYMRCQSNLAQVTQWTPQFQRGLEFEHQRWGNITYTLCGRGPRNVEGLLKMRIMPEKAFKAQVKVAYDVIQAQFYKQIT
ncbi:hypothetical protein BT63DRAFT_436699 [Microthyrium microscopicum]|uniref:Uncharacterized protein n=1 Tax=Microthyrium microscopicum TaxID=703497 RepID=A0A6A6UN16_9PEZI|nr:hypothetical protein BT63DRAFT_436699 [Microthyrium microscopicum]